MNASDEPVSPCIGICELDAQNLCRGCLRSRAEITAWFTAGDAEKRDILKTVAERKTAIAESAA